VHTDGTDRVREALQAEGRPFRPLDRVVLVDRFDDARDGWYLHTIDREPYDADWGVVCRSTMPSHRYGSHGAQSGHYSLKLATLPEAGRTTTAIKRLTMPYHSGEWYDTLRFETFFAYHEQPRGLAMDTEIAPERDDLTGESAVRSFSFEFDLHNREHRWWPGLRYHNFENDEKRATWQYNAGGIDPLLSEFTDVPDGRQALCWNSPNDSVPWKPNWHYLRIDLDMEDLSYREFQCNDAVYDLRGLDHAESDPVHEEGGKVSPWPDIDGLLNPIARVQTNRDTRSFLFVDSLAVSATVEG
jgi:hypothetical protein